MSFDIERIRKSKRRVTKFVKRNAKRPSSDAVHKLRTGARHLRTAMVTLGLESERDVDSFLGEIKKIRRLAGKLRDMDVLTADALSIDWRGEQDCLVRLVEYLGAERNKRARKLRTRIAKRRPQILRSLKRGLDRIEHVATDGRRDADSAAVRETVSRAIQLSSKLKRPGRLTRKNLHEYRLKVKELRDVLRLSDRAADTALVQKLKGVSDAIGDWHDWVELTDIALNALDHGASCELSRRLAATRESKYRHALSLAHALTTRHLRPKPRKPRKRSMGRPSIAEPVLEAAAAITEEKNPEIAH